MKTIAAVSPQSQGNIQELLTCCEKHGVLFCNCYLMSNDIELEFVPHYVVTRQVLPPAKDRTKYMVPPCGIQTAVPQHLH